MGISVPIQWILRTIVVLSYSWYCVMIVVTEYSIGLMYSLSVIKWKTTIDRFSGILEAFTMRSYRRGNYIKLCL
jgi:hypothetical protein